MKSLQIKVCGLERKGEVQILGQAGEDQPVNCGGVF